MTAPHYFSGQFLLATPGMADPNFARSIIAICAHDEHGALGINIGAQIAGIGFHKILEQFDIAPGDAPNCSIYHGGPVDQERGFVLHSLDFNMSETLQVGTRWGLSSSVEILKAIASGKGPESWLIALGYSGWGEGQLEEELTQNGWAIAKGKPAWIYSDDNADKWKAAWADEGIDPGKLSGQFGTA